ncbi:MAG: hypothetical protein QXN71_04100 [Candidatus Aenigmatarchaeota archaeon]
MKTKTKILLISTLVVLLIFWSPWLWVASCEGGYYVTFWGQIV